MGETAPDPLSGFQFATIGQLPSLASRISDAAPDDAVSPSPSPLSSPKMPASSIAPGSSRLLNILAPEPPLPTTSHQSSPATAQPRSLPGVNGLPPRPSAAAVGPNSVPEQRRPPAQGPSRTSTSASVNIPSGAPSQRPTLNLAATKPLSAPSGAAAFTPLGLSATSPTSVTSGSPLADDAVGSFRQSLKGLQKELEEYRRREEENQQAMARQQAQAARWHARAEAMVENISPLLATAEQRIGAAERRAAQLQEETTQYTEELRKVRAVATQLEDTNAALRRELEEVRIQAVERQRAAEARVLEAITKSSEAMARAESHEHERQLAEKLLRARLEARERELLAQLQEERRHAALKQHELTQEIHALQQEVEDLKRANEKEKELRMEELREEKRKLQLREEQLQAQMVLQNSDGHASVKSRAPAGATPTSAASPPQPSQSPAVAAVSLSAPSSVDTSRLSPERARRVKELHISTAKEVPHASTIAGSSHPGTLTSPQEGKSSTQSPHLEPLLAIKAEDLKVVVKSEVESPQAGQFSHPLSKQAEHTPVSNVQGQRREQLLDYAPPPQEPATASTVERASGHKSAVSSGSDTSSRPSAADSHVEAHSVSQHPSPAVSFGADSPGPAASSNASLPLFPPSADSSHDDVRPPGKASTFIDARVAPGARLASSSTHPEAVPPRPPLQSNPQSPAVLFAPVSVARTQADSLSHLPRPPSPPVIQRVTSDGQRSFRLRRGNRSSPGPDTTYPPRPESPPAHTRRGDHWSPGPDRVPDGSRRPYSPPVRHKRTRDAEALLDAPETRRPRLDTYRPSPPRRLSSQSDRPMYAYGARRTPPRSPSPGPSADYPPTYEQDLSYPPQHLYPHPQTSNHHFERHESPPPRPDRARTPPYPPGHYMHQSTSLPDPLYLRAAPMRSPGSPPPRNLPRSGVQRRDLGMRLSNPNQTRKRRTNRGRNRS
ncbi:hypothetical protein OH76DRAFT_1552281 [Lentinus brumalis]|uniref:Uncharacterized protein n=1 Tax=Lentinus brumalis TaxID=2498619 RepID=A0A371DR57_9APHY|nr:hypothetical protein OH76DRAFT_1552281 [Polyporus brumalis]